RSLIGRQHEFRIDRQEWCGFNRDSRQDIGRLLISAIEPCLVGCNLDSRCLLNLVLIRDRKWQDQRDFVDEHQPVDTGNLDAKAESCPDCHYDSEEKECDEDRKQRKCSADPSTPDVRPDQRKEFHEGWSPESTPFSR